jgi:hypothetical protein
MPIVLRLTRQGDTITAEYSTDDGRTFQPGGGRTFDPSLPNALYVGPMISSGHVSETRSQTSRARFDRIEIRKL